MQIQADSVSELMNNFSSLKCIAYNYCQRSKVGGLWLKIIEIIMTLRLSLQVKYLIKQSQLRLSGSGGTEYIN